MFQKRVAVILATNSKSLGEAPGSGGEELVGQVFTTTAHCFEAFERFQSADEDETIPSGAFCKNIEEPVHPVVQIDIGVPGGMIIDEFPG